MFSVTKIKENSDWEKFALHPDERISSYKTIHHEGNRYLICWWDQANPPFWEDVKAVIKTAAKKGRGK